MALLSGCVHYAAQPVLPTTIATAQAAREIDNVAIGAELTRIAPGIHFDPARWNRLTLFAAIIIGNPDVLAARKALTTATAAARSARSPATGPTLTLTSEYAGAAPDPSPWLFGGAIDVPIDRGGRRAARLDNADLAVEIARYDYVETIWTARMAVVRALAAHFVADRQLAVLDNLLALRQRHFDAMSRRVEAGEASRTELERVRADLSDALRRRDGARVQGDAEIAKIATLVGLPAVALAGVTFEWTGFDTAVPIPPLNASARIGAIVGRADILKGMAAYDQSEADLRGEVAKQFPAISIAPGYTWERGLVKLPLSVGLALPPLDLNRRAITAAEARRSEAGARIEALVASAGGAIDMAAREAEAARAALAAVHNGELVIARRLANHADAELTSGAIDRTDWAAAQGGLAAARLSELDALARVHAADAALDDALRRPQEGPETMIINRTPGP
ncbi:MAG: TolC family protein [Sphingomonadales bacterium]